MRWISPLIAAAAVAALAVYFWPAAEAPAPQAMAARSEPEPARHAPVPVMVLSVRAEATAARLLVPARTEADRRVEVAAETAGRVVSEPIRRGARVAAGDVLCRLDPGSRPAQLAEAEARRAEAAADAAAAESLSAKGFTAETTRMTRRAELEAAQAAVDLMRLDIDRLEIRAPFSGLLETDTAELGALLAVGESCARVIDLSRLRAVGFVAERMVDRIALGGPAGVRLANGETAEGRVSFIASAADAETRTYEVEVVIENPDGRLRDGMTAELAIALSPVSAHRIPQSALTLDDAGRLGVRLAEGAAARFAAVEILRDEPGGLWVRGLPERARVIVVGQEFVRDGRAIAPTEIGWGDLG